MQDNTNELPLEVNAQWGEVMISEEVNGDSNKTFEITAQDGTVIGHRVTTANGIYIEDVWNEEANNYQQVESTDEETIGMFIYTKIEHEPTEDEELPSEEQSNQEDLATPDNSDVSDSDLDEDTHTSEAELIEVSSTKWFWKYDSSWERMIFTKDNIQYFIEEVVNDTEMYVIQITK